MKFVLSDGAKIVLSGEFTPDEPKAKPYDFKDGTFGPFTAPFGHARVIDDPTKSGRGKVVELTLAPTEENRSADVSLAATLPQPIRYGRSVVAEWDCYLPTNPLNDPAWRPEDLRKLFDAQGASADGWTGGGARFILSRAFDHVTNAPCLHLEVESHTTIDGIQQPNQIQYWADFAWNSVPFDAWLHLKLQLVTNSADGVADGFLRFWLNGEPVFETPHTLEFINEKWAPAGPSGLRVGSYLNVALFGSQLSNAAPLPLNTEVRYLDNIVFAVTQ